MTVALAQAFPTATCTGFDYHEPSIDAARKAAAEAGVSDPARFEVAAVTAFPGGGYDLICFFDCLHDMGDPVGAARHARAALADDGTVVLLVEPKAGDDLTENLNPIRPALLRRTSVPVHPNHRVMCRSGCSSFDV